MKNTYNGWANRETWLVNLHFSENLEDLVKECVESEVINVEDKRGEVIYEIADYCKDYIEDMLEEEVNGLSSFIRDYLDFSLIEWHEIATNLYDDIIKNG